MKSMILILILIGCLSMTSMAVNFDKVYIDPSTLPVLSCDENNLEQQFCLFQSNRDQGFIYNNSAGTLEFSGVIADVRNDTFCQIYIIAKSVWLEYSNITGCDIFINASLVLKLQNSAISAEGSITLGPGYVNNTTSVHYAGSGGFCQASSFNSSNFYGDYNSAYDDYNVSLGSGGTTSSVAGIISLNV